MMITKNNKLHTYLMLLGLCLLLGVSLAACASSAETPVTVTETQPQASQPEQKTVENMAGTVVVATPVPENNKPDPGSIDVDWQSSPHANAYVQDAQGNNNSCARCHAPVNWMPSMDELPESCFACKFEIKDPPQYIAENDWTNVSCNICHTVDKKKNIQAEVAWLEIPPLGEYSEVTSTTELCLKCHAPVNISGHGVVDLEGVHAGYDCTKCHSAHSTTASCDTPGCHIETATPAAGHDADHAAVSCVACHAAVGIEVGPDEEATGWTTFVSQTTDAGTEKFSFVSHNIVLEARCDRCHFAGNSWGLSEQPVQP